MCLESAVAVAVKIWKLPYATNAAVEKNFFFSHLARLLLSLSFVQRKQVILGAHFVMPWNFSVDIFFSSDL